MLVNAEFLSLLVLVASAAALGLSILIDVGRVSAERTRVSVLQRQIEKRKSALKEWTAKTASRDSELKTVQARLTEAVNRRQKLQVELKALEHTKVEMVHELGECDGAAIGYWAPLAISQEAGTAERRDIIFSRQIWTYRNCAQIWAGSPDHAAGLLYAAFSARSGVVATTMFPLGSANEVAEATAS